MTTTLINLNGVQVDANSVTVPAFRDFRGAWVRNGDVIDTDMDKARDIQKDAIRADRAPMLDALDVDTMKALESGSDVSGIAAQKQALRGITDDPRIAAAKTPEELKALTLDALLA